MVIPIRGQYEQFCNAAALAKMGVPVLDALDAGFEGMFRPWMGAEEKAPPSPGLFDGVDRQLSDAPLHPGKEACAGYAVSGCGVQLEQTAVQPVTETAGHRPARLEIYCPGYRCGVRRPGSWSRVRSRQRAAKKKATIMEMKWLLHEKIQLYIYKPSINRCN